MEDSIVEESKKRMGRPPGVKPTEASDVATLQATVNALMEQVKQLQNPGIIKQEKHIDEHFAKLKLWDEKLVVGVGSVKTNYKEPNPELRLIIELVLRKVDGSLEKVSAPYKVFMEEGLPVLCKIIEDKRVMKNEVKEYANKLSVGKNAVTGDIASTDMPTSERIAMEVSRIERNITLEVLEGEQTGALITFDDSNINSINA